MLNIVTVRRARLVVTLQLMRTLDVLVLVGQCDGDPGANKLSTAAQRLTVSFTEIRSSISSVYHFCSYSLSMLPKLATGARFKLPVPLCGTDES